jgi:hypothetical protein
MLRRFATSVVRNSGSVKTSQWPSWERGYMIHRPRASESGRWPDDQWMQELIVSGDAFDCGDHCSLDACASISARIISTYENLERPSMLNIMPVTSM